MENSITLSNGVKMPRVGYGVYQITRNDCAQCVEDALSVGYRMIDTAQSYANEAEVGEGIRQSGVPRADIFLTTKLWIPNADYTRAKTSIDRSLEKSGTDFIDLLLLHQPFGDIFGAWRAMEEAQKAGKVRALGVANFQADHLVNFCNYVDIQPTVNQVETHVFCQQKELRHYMKQFGVVHESWAPFAEGRNDFFQNPVLAAVGAKHGKTSPQVALRYLYQKDVVIIPKSVHRTRMAENLAIFDFELDVEDVASIEALDTGKSLFFDHHDPETVLTMWKIARERKGWE